MTIGDVSPPCGVVASPGVIITAGPEPCRVATHVGATIHIVLNPGFNWDTPRSNSSVVEVVNVKRHASGRLDANVHASRIGNATVSAVGSVLCRPGKACPALARLWSMHITVRAISIRTITVTQADGGHSYQLRKGDRLNVQLSGSSMYTWTEPNSSDNTVLERFVGSSGVTGRAAFLAFARGKVKVTATDSPNCYPQCLAPSRLFEVSVSVLG